MAKRRTYRVLFRSKDDTYEVYAKSVSQGELFGFIEIEQLVFGERTQVVVDPGEERLEREFEGVKRVFIPMHAVIRIDEVEKEGVSRVILQRTDGKRSGVRRPPARSRHGPEGESMAWMRQKSEPQQPIKPTQSPETSKPVAQSKPAEPAQAPAPAPKKEEPKMEKRANVGQSVKISGELTASEDLTIEGQVEGSISLPDNNLTIGANGRITAQVMAKTVTVLGQVAGDVVAKEKVDIAPSGSVEGDICSPRVAIADGARFRGAIDMESGTASTQSKPEKQQSQSSHKHDQPKIAQVAS
jgi:cytoskeletal protein CcmA (bactofilin family)